MPPLAQSAVNAALFAQSGLNVSAARFVDHNITASVTVTGLATFDANGISQLKARGSLRAHALP